MRPGNQGALIQSRSAARLKLAAAIGAIALLLAACGGGSGSDVTATLRIHVGTVEVQAGSGAFATATDGQALSEGDAVRTGADGRASIEWPDGSVTRLDVDTTFRIEELSGGSVLSPSTAIEGTQETGNSFSRVVELTETGDRFSIATPTASAAVQGTEYYVLIGAGGSGTIVVTDGAVVVTTESGEEVVVQTGQSVVVDADGNVEGPFPTTQDTLDDDWVRYNDQCDASGGVCPTDVPGALDRIEVVPVDATINLGESQAFTAEGFDGDGESLGTVDASFSIDEGACPDGLCTPSEPGDFVVSAEFEGLSATANLTVLATGDIQVTLDWAAFVDLDLYVTDPDGETVSWQNVGSTSGGRLDRDGYAACTTDEPPPENIVWDVTAPPGDYLVGVTVYDMCDQPSVDFELTVRIGGEIVLSETGTLTASGENYDTSFTKS
ncbi:MAG TPA: FecR domain-containing protein [Acidimicrobiia bacterium]|nr:FecR domain-containing protein [Acidimicrobiia bacterium]